MTADILTAAQREGGGRWPYGDQWNSHEIESARGRFIMGAVWAAARVIPTREQLVALLEDERHYDSDQISNTDRADAVLALMAGLAEGEK